MKFLRYAVCVVLAFAVLAHGGVEEWSRAVLETSAGLLFLSWVMLAFLSPREEIHVPSVLFPLAGFSLLVLVLGLLHRTASVYTTRVEFQLLLADFLLILVAAQVFRTVQDWRGFVWFVMIFAFLVSGFGVLQHLTFNGKLYWFREMRFGGIPFGPYVNRNHFAGFAELVIPLAYVPLALGKVRRERLFLVAILALLPLVALLLSASRGGMVSVGIEFFILLLLLVLRRSMSKHAVAGAAVLLLALVMVSWLGVRQILARFGSLQTLEVTESKRASMRHDTWRIFLDHPLTGVGLGALPIVYPSYETLYDGKIVTHAHNDYLEALAETGILGGLLCAWFVEILFLQGFSLIRQNGRSFAAALHLAGLTACCGFLTHSLVDFNLHVPANALLFFLMALLASVPMQPAASPDAAAPSYRYPRIP